MDQEIACITRQSSRQAAHVLGRSFADEPVSMVIYKNFSLDRRIRALTVDFTAEILLCIRKGYPLQINSDGQVIAAAVIYPPGAYPLPGIDQWMLLIKSILGNGYYDISSWKRWLEEADHFHPREPHYYLEYLGVEPSQQGRSFGSTLLRHLTNKADKEGVGCYLETGSPRSISLYQYFGFNSIAEKEIIGIPAWFMWRSPNSA
jgi:ribosomal protein S18 acetylase RimI-like enzyme